MALGRKIVLIGPMGAGKTSLGRRLASKLRWRFCDTDHLLTTTTGVDIPTIFAREGEAGFRKREERALAEALNAAHDTVVACGGGIVLSRTNRYLIAQQRLVVFLDVSVARQLERVREDKNRPLTQVADLESRLKALREERLGLYEGLADWRLDTDDNRFSLSFRRLLQEARNRIHGELKLSGRRKKIKS